MRSKTLLAIVAMTVLGLTSCSTFKEKFGTAVEKTKSKQIANVVAKVEANGVAHFQCRTGKPLGKFVGLKLEKYLRVENSAYKSAEKGIVQDVCTFAVKKSVPWLLDELSDVAFTEEIKRDGCNLSGFEEDLEGEALKLCSKINAEKRRLKNGINIFRGISKNGYHLKKERALSLRYYKQS